MTHPQDQPVQAPIAATAATASANPANTARSASPASTPVTGGPPAAVVRRARALAHWYPASWRAKYGDEFTELLIAELTERPRSAHRTADVAIGGIRARLAGAGLAGHLLDPAAAARSSLASLACAAAGFAVAGTALSGQLAIGLQWSGHDIPAITMAAALMWAALLAFATLSLLAAIPVVWALITASASGAGRPLLRPALLTAAGLAVLVVGGRHFANGWPGTGGTWWAAHGLVPSGVAAFGWATTISVTSYWAHPASLAGWPASELAWLVISPCALALTVAGLAGLVRRAELTQRALTYQSWLAAATVPVMATFFGGALCWVASAGMSPQRSVRPGMIDLAGLAVLALALMIGSQAGYRIRLAVTAAHGRARHDRDRAGPAGRSRAGDRGASAVKRAGGR